MRVLPRIVLVLATAALLAGCGSSGGTPAPAPTGRTSPTAGPVAVGTPVATARPSPSPRRTQRPRPRPQLPLGGRRLLPHYRVVAYYGAPGMNVLGSAPPAAIVPRLEAAARPFARPDRPVQPAMELITTIADRRPGPDGDYSHALDPSVVQRYYDVAHRDKLLLLLDLQPGRGDFLAQAKQLEPFLRRPDVGLALDPEWKMGPGQVPATVVGHDDAADINRVSSWLAAEVARYDLPQKLFVVHQFTVSMIEDKAAIVARGGLATVLHVDGFGGRSQKLAKYRLLHVRRPLFNGFKLFYSEDVGLFSPAETLSLTPAPDLVTYQ